MPETKPLTKRTLGCIVVFSVAVVTAFMVAISIFTTGGPLSLGLWRSSMPATTPEPYSPLPKPSLLAARKLTTIEAMSFLSDAGFGDWKSVATDDGGSETTSKHDGIVYHFKSMDRFVNELAVIGDDSSPERVKELRRVAGILVRRATGQPFPEELAVALNKPGEKMIELGGWVVMAVRKDGVVLVGLGKPK